MATQTWTLDVAGLKYIDADKIEHTINTNETITFTFTDSGAGGTFVALEGGGQIDCADGYSVTPCCDKRFVWESVTDYGTGGYQKADRTGEMCFVEPSGLKHPFRIASLRMANADGTGANNVVEIIFESVLHGWTMTWTNVNTA